MTDEFHESRARFDADDPLSWVGFALAAVVIVVLSPFGLAYWLGQQGARLWRRSIHRVRR